MDQPDRIQDMRDAVIEASTIVNDCFPGEKVFFAEHPDALEAQVFPHDQEAFMLYVKQVAKSPHSDGWHWELIEPNPEDVTPTGFAFMTRDCGDLQQVRVKLALVATPSCEVDWSMLVLAMSIVAEPVPVKDGF